MKTCVRLCDKQQQTYWDEHNKPVDCTVTQVRKHKGHVCHTGKIGRQSVVQYARGSMLWVDA